MGRNTTGHVLHRTRVKQAANTMSNLTLVIDDDLLRAARIKALQQGTSVNEICREAIARFAAPADDHAAFAAELRALSDKMGRNMPAERASPLWPGREALYEEAMAERMPTLWASLGSTTGVPKK
jgi:hypothetical protein